MTQNEPHPDDFADLRRRAEEKARAVEVQVRQPPLPEEARRLLHELQVHQIELEMQNEELRRSQGELEASRARYFDLFDLAPVGYFTLSEKGLILEANITGAGLLGVERRDVMKQPLSHFILPEDQDIYYRHRKRLMETRSPQAFELRLVKEAGGPFWVRVEATVAQDGESGLPVCRAVVSDITERKRTEEEKLELERRLLHAQKLESLGVMAGGIAHDFNNILAGIMGYADLAKMHLPAIELVRADVEVIKKAALRAADLTKQMLAYSGKGKFVVEPLSLSQVVDDSKKMLAMSVSKKASVNYDLATDLPAMRADAGQIGQVIMNLVINASEAIGEEGGAISISTDAVQCSTKDMGAGTDTPAGLYVRLKVADTGCGMDPPTLDKIFDPFFTTKFTGRGLGLAAVHGIVRGHKGAIRVSSEPGHGTSFQVMFPASAGAVPPTGTQSIETSTWRGSGTVLVVDDEEIIRIVASRMLELAGFSVLTASDGQEAIRLYQQHPQEIVCVLLDLTMPKMNGKETFRELRRIHNDVRVILSSGYCEADATAGFAGMELRGFLQKPYQHDTMIARFRVALADSPECDVPGRSPRADNIS